MEISCCFPPGPNAARYAELAEGLGYRRVWLYDSPALYPDVWVGLAEVAKVTTRVGLGPAVLVPSLRHVMVNAAAIARLEQLAPSRLAVAIGTGFTGRHVLGQRPERWRDVAAYIRSLRELLAGKETEVDGALVSLLHAPGLSAERPIPTPVIVAANGPKGLRVAREEGDGVMAISGVAAPAGFDWCTWLAWGTVLDPGEEISSPRVVDAAGAGVGVTYHALYERAPEMLDALPGGQAWRASVEAVPELRRHLDLHEGHFMYLNERDRKVLVPEAISRLTWTGTAEEIRTRVHQAATAGATEILYAPMGPQVERELECFAAAAISSQN